MIRAPRANAITFAVVARDLPTATPLLAPYESTPGSLVSTVSARSANVGRRRPNQFQGFVFADGQFAGTISPAPMDSRTDGTGRVVDGRGGMLSAQFVRYAATDPLCCPSSVFFVEYTVDRTGPAPLLVPKSSTRTTAQAAF